MRQFIGVVIIILSVIGFFFHLTPEELSSANSRAQVFAIIFTLPWYGKIITLLIGWFLLTGFSNKESN